MTKTISLKHNASAFFKGQIAQFKKSTQEGLRLLKTDVNSISLDSPQAYESRVGESTLQTPIPHNFYDATALTEASRGDSYAVFEELKGQGVTVFDIKTSLAQRGVLDNFLQDRVMNLILQCRGAVHFGVAQPVQQLAALHGMIVSPETESLNLVLDVQNPEQVILKIEIPIQTLDKQSGLAEQIGIVNCDLSITKSSIYLKEMTYTKTSDTPNAEKLFEITSADYSWLSEIWSIIKELFGFVEQEPEFELSLNSPKT